MTALRDIDLSVRAGEIFGIIGLSGAGKSTLVRCMNYLEHPTEGSVTVDGKKLGALNKTELLNARRGIGMIFQQFNLLMQKTALDNICFPLEIAGVSRREAIGAGTGASEARRAGRQGKGLSRPALRRAEAEGSHSPGPCAQPEGAALR